MIQRADAMAMLPREHPLHKIVGRKSAGKVKRHKSSINSLLAEYEYDLKRFKKIPASTRDPMQSGKHPFTTNTAPDRNSSIRTLKNANEEVQVFTDGSAIDGKVGAAAVLARTGNPPRTLHFHLGPDSEHTVHSLSLARSVIPL
jgi:hypothetical protein